MGDNRCVYCDTQSISDQCRNCGAPVDYKWVKPKGCEDEPLSIISAYLHDHPSSSRIRVSHSDYRWLCVTRIGDTAINQLSFVAQHNPYTVRTGQPLEIKADRYYQDLHLTDIECVFDRHANG